MSSLFLTHLYEPSDNSLFLEIKESTTSKVTEDVVIGNKTIPNCRRVSINEFGYKYNISFQSYIAYHIMNESFLNFNDWDEYEVGEYDILYTFKKSRYLDFILRETIADYIFPGEIKHYGLYCTNHAVQIISTQEPKIEKINCAQQQV